MKKVLLALFVLVPAVTFAAAANRDGDLGLGVMVGDTTSITAKYWTSERSAVSVGAGGKYSQEGWLQADWVRHFLGSLGTSTRFISEMGPYVGIGLGAGFNRTISNVKYQNDWFARVPVGLAWLPARTPVDLFIELAPTWDFAPTSVAYFSGNLGARYYF